MAASSADNNSGEADQLQADLKALRKDIDTLAKDVSEIGRNQLRRVRASALDAANETEERLSLTVRERPLQSLAASFAIGYLFALFSRS